MQSWPIKLLELEGSALDHLSGFMHEHALAFFMGAIYLLLALLGWVLSGGLSRKWLKGKPMPDLRPMIGIQLPSPPRPPTETFNPPLCDPPDCDCEGRDWD